MHQRVVRDVFGEECRSRTPAEVQASVDEAMAIDDPQLQQHVVVTEENKESWCQFLQRTVSTAVASALGGEGEEEAEEREKEAKEEKAGAAGVVKQLGAAVAPCQLGSVDRCCLSGERACGQYVTQEINVARYGSKYKLLGQGTYGAVWSTTNNYAVKCMLEASPATEFSAADLRELVVLRNLIHPNVVYVEQVALANNVMPQCFVGAVLPLLNGTIGQVDVTQDRRLRASIMYQFVRAVAYIHSRGVIHRDIKPANVLWHHATQTIRLADFGLSQPLASPRSQYETNVVTIWYRAPELFLGEPRYTGAIDVWAIAASWIEMLGSEQLHTIDDLQDALVRIFMIAGEPSLARWPAAMSLPRWPHWRRYARVVRPLPLAMALQRHAASVTEDEIRLLERMFELDPARRISAYDALQHGFFDSVRNQVETAVPAAPIPTPALVGCGDVMFAMELPPVGDYIAKAFPTERQKERKEWLKTLFDWLNAVRQKIKQPVSTLILAVDIFHRVAAANTHYVLSPDRLQGYAVACYLIACKLDADAYARLRATDASRLTEGLVTATKIVAFEREILKQLDMDLDRPTAATFFAYYASGLPTSTDVKLATTSLWQQYVNNYEMHVNYRGSQMAWAALADVNAESPCMTRVVEAFPALFAPDKLPTGAA
jgi:serine/threonine protein kinase